MVKIEPANNGDTNTMSNEDRVRDMYEKELVKKRHNCTDIICLLLFLVFIAVQIALSILIYVNAGDPKNLLLPHDSNGELCTSPKENLLYHNLLECLSPTVLVSGCSSVSVCVASCPDQNLFYPIDSHRAILYSTYCSRSLLNNYYNGAPPSSINAADYLTLANKRICPYYALASSSYFYRCVPSIVSSLANSTLPIVANDTSTGASININVNNQDLTGKTVSDAANYLFKILDLQTIGNNNKKNKYKIYLFLVRKIIELFI